MYNSLLIYLKVLITLIKSLLYPLLAHDVVYVGVFVFVSIRVDFVVAAQESTLVKGVLTRHVSSFTYLI